MIDISKAEWVISQPHPLIVKEMVRIGALFIFDGMMKEIMVTSPDLEYVGEEDGELSMIFSRYDAALMESLKNITSPTFVIIRMEKKNGKASEMGYHILEVMFFRRYDNKQIGIRMKVRAGKPV